ncbi:MAG: MlaD family protein [Woeseiaceae bacterium]|jgi:paraquat-inducible protein B|nr:MlaD family protein [Woeseiaceae bacterium]
MSKQAHTTLIGAFVVGAAVLLAIGAALFGGSELFQKRTTYVAYFDETTTGLRTGANVVANGVRVGYVSEIALLIDESTYQTLTRVTLVILPEAYIPVRNGQQIGAHVESAFTHRELVEDAGLRAQLEIESFITGQLLVRLDNRPDTEAIMRGVDPPYPEIPTIRSNIQEILDRVQNWASDIRDSVDIDVLSNNLNDALRNIANLAGSADLQETLGSLKRVVGQVETRGVVSDLDAAIGDLGQAARALTDVLENTDNNIEDIAGDIKPVLASLQQTIEEANRMLELGNRQLRGDTEQIEQFQSTFREIEQAARAMREFFDYMERNPEAFLKGRQE